MNKLTALPVMLTALLAVLAPACSGPTPGPPGTGGSGGGVGGSGGDDNIKLVPAQPKIVEGSGFCLPLQSGESLAAVSPEGHAWLVTSEGQEQALRILDPFEPQTIVEDSLQMGSITHLLAWSDGDASVVSTDGLWALEGMSRVAINEPTALSGITSLCGTFETDGALIGSGAVHELRDGYWWLWSALATASAAPEAWLRFDGECVGRSNLSLLWGKDGSLLEVGASSYLTIGAFEAEAMTAATDGVVAILESERLMLGPSPWQAWAFEGAHPTKLSASGAQVWFAAGTQLLRYQHGDFVEISGPMTGSIDSVHAHASGAWLSSEGQLCHVATGSMLRVEGVRPYQRSEASSYTISVSADEASVAVTASLGDEPITLTEDSETGKLTGQAELPTVGWHDLVLQGGDAKRVIPIKREPTVTRSWKADIQPIFADHCAGSTCHSEISEAAPSFDNYGAWVAASQTINNRVVIAGTMPPSNHQGSEWPDKKQIIAEWLEGGMLP